MQETSVCLAQQRQSIRVPAVHVLLTNSKNPDLASGMLSYQNTLTSFQEQPLQFKRKIIDTTQILNDLNEGGKLNSADRTESMRSLQ